jgi:xylosylprotein 4-beta-galactosyltransferase
MNRSKYKTKQKNAFKLLSVTNYDNTQSVSIALIIPHRKNIDYLKKFIKWIAQLEKSSLHTYNLYIIDQNNFDRFNKGLLLGVGFYIAKNANYDRYIFHDIGLYPSQEIFNLYFSELDKNIYFHDGVIGFNSDDFEKINGFPLNLFGHNGGEYDCLFNRSQSTNVKIFKPQTSSYTYEARQTFNQIEVNKHKTDNIMYDLKNWSKNGIKQLEKYFINYKQYDVDNFIENYSINDSNLVNNAELLYKYKSESKNNVNVFKID